MRHAACSCGALTAACEGEPVRISVCHCLDCQRRTGSAFGAAAFFPVETVRTAGQSTVYERKGDSGGTIRFHFCPRCGTSVFWSRDTRPEVLGVAIGAFADPGFPTPDKEVYRERSHAWAFLDLPGQE